MKTAIVHDWFANYMGSEKCVESFVNIWNDAEIFSLVDFLSDEERKIILKGKEVTTSFIQKLPFAKTKFRNYLPFFPLAIEQLNVSASDVILSSSHAVAKGIITNRRQLHICYCHTPIRYAWDLYHQYLKEANLTKGLKAFISKMILHYIRMWDYTTANRVDYFIANSNYVAKRIEKIYGKKADVIYPPVDTEHFRYKALKDDYYLAAARFVPYKKIDLIVEAFSKMPDKRLVVIGDGPEEEKIKKLATKNIELIGHQPFPNLIEYVQNAKAFIFAAEEDFGITNVEAEATGTPIIAYGKGGVTETVINGKTGIFFDKQNIGSVKEAVEQFEKNIDKFDSNIISEHAQKFSRERFEEEIKHYVEKKYSIHER